MLFSLFVKQYLIRGVIVQQLRQNVPVARLFCVFSPRPRQMAGLDEFLLTYFQWQRAFFIFMLEIGDHTKKFYSSHVSLNFRRKSEESTRTGFSLQVWFQNSIACCFTFLLMNTWLPSRKAMRLYSALVKNGLSFCPQENVQLFTKLKTFDYKVKRIRQVRKLQFRLTNHCMNGKIFPDHKQVL